MDLFFYNCSFNKLFKPHFLSSSGSLLIWSRMTGLFYCLERQWSWCSRTEPPILLLRANWFASATDVLRVSKVKSSFFFLNDLFPGAVCIRQMSRWSQIIYNCRNLCGHRIICMGKHIWKSVFPFSENRTTFVSACSHLENFNSKLREPTHIDLNFQSLVSTDFL